MLIQLGMFGLKILTMKELDSQKNHHQPLNTKLEHPLLRLDLGYLVLTVWIAGQSYVLMHTHGLDLILHRYSVQYIYIKLKHVPFNFFFADALILSVAFH